MKKLAFIIIIVVTGFTILTFAEQEQSAVKPFGPDEKTLNIIKDLKGKPPVSDKAIEEHENGESY